MAKCKDREDDLGREVKSRILNVSDLVAPEARYHKYCYRAFFKDKQTKDSLGRPVSELREAFAKLCGHIENNEDCQYNINDLQTIMKNISGLQESYVDKHLKNLLKEHFKDRLFFPMHQEE